MHDPFMSDAEIDLSVLRPGSALPSLSGGLACVCGECEGKRHLYKLERLLKGKWLVLCIAGHSAPAPGLHSVEQTAYREALFSESNEAWLRIPGMNGIDEQVKSLLDRRNLERLLQAEYPVLLISSESPAEQASNHLYRQFDCKEVRTLSDEEGLFASQLKIPRWEFRSRLHLPRLSFVAEEGVVTKAWFNVNNPRTHIAEIVSALT